MRILILGLVSLAGVYGQYGHQRFSWQDACFKNPRLPYCLGHDSAVKPERPGKKDATHNTSSDSDPLAPLENVTPEQIAAGAIDWRFADPSSDALVGFHARKLSALPLARTVIAQLGANQGLGHADMEKIFERLSGVNQVAISIHDNQTVVMITGRGSDSTAPHLEQGWKAVPVVGNAMLVGHAEAVDQAVKRMALDDPPGDLVYMATGRQAASEFWAVASAGLVGPQAGSTSVQRFGLTVAISDHITSDLALEFNTAPDANTLKSWAPALKGSIDGNVVHVTTTIEANEVQKKFGPIAASPIGEHLTSLVKATRYLPERDASAPKQAKPKILGLDSGPIEVNQ